MRILIVDDQALSRKMVETALKEMGFDNLAMAESGVEAVEFLSSNTVDVVIADWRMPGLNGLDLLKWVRSEAAIKDLPVLMLTGDRAKESVVAALQSGVSDYLVKPFSEAQLAGKLARIGKD